MIPEKIPQDFYSRPTDKRIEWWNLFLQSLSETIKDILKKITNKNTIMVDGVQKKLLIKTITGSLNSLGSLLVPHGLDVTKIVSFSTLAYNSAISEFFVQDWQGGSDVFYPRLSGTNIGLFYTTNYYEQSFKITIFYYE